MTPEEKKQFEELLTWKRQLESSFSIPRNVEGAFRVHLGGIYAAQNTTGSYTGANIRRVISLSGSAEDISVLEDPAGYILVQFGTGTYKIPYFND